MSNINISNFLFPLMTEQELKEAYINYMHFLRNNRNNFSYWFPKIRVVKQHDISIPESHIVEVPEEIYKAFFLESPGDKRSIRQFVHKSILPVIQSHFNGKEVFIKNGCYSGKFQFNKCCHLPTDATLKTITEHLCNIQYDSLMKKKAGNLEIVLREWIKPDAGTKTIYGGMPLRAEIRLFYDFTEHKPLYWVNYWDYDYCHEAICSHPEDKEVYEKYYPYIHEEAELYCKEHWKTVLDALAQVKNLEGKWSVDFILTERQVWLIDMAIASMSAYWMPTRNDYI